MGSLWSIAEDFMTKAKKFHEERAPDRIIERAEASKSWKRIEEGRKY